MSFQVVLIRHGESVWNKENRFTGWTDVGLSPTGETEAHRAGQLLQKQGYTFDLAYTSVLKRAIQTLNVILGELDLEWVPVQKFWRLNERHYGNLQGLNKTEMAEKFGEKQVFIWRRSFDVQPPPLTTEDPRHPVHDRRYAGILATELPATESLKNCVARVLPTWQNDIAPAIRRGKRVLIAAHGNSLRALLMTVKNINETDIMEINIPTGVPLVLEFDNNMIYKHDFYLGDADAIAAAQARVAAQGKAQT